MMASIASATAELLGRCMDMERKMLFYKRAWEGQIARNKACACMIDDETGEVITPCRAHAEWRDASVEYALKHQPK